VGILTTLNFRKKSDIPPVEASHLVVQSSSEIHLEHALSERQGLGKSEHQYTVLLEEDHLRGRQSLRELGAMPPGEDDEINCLWRAGLTGQSFERAPVILTWKRMEVLLMERSAALSTRKRVDAETATVMATEPENVQATRSGRRWSS
jgi:hypothetical protein